MDRLIMKGLTFWGCHGLNLIEKQEPQRFVVDVELYLDLAEAGKTDRIDKTADYSFLYQEVKRVVTENKYNLIERLAEVLAARLLELTSAGRVVVEVKKPRPPLAGEYEYFAVRIERERK